MYYEDPYPKRNVGCVGFIFRYLVETAMLAVGVTLFLMCLGVIGRVIGVVGQAAP